MERGGGGGIMVTQPSARQFDKESHKLAPSKSLVMIITLLALFFGIASGPTSSYFSHNIEFGRISTCYGCEHNKY